MSVMCPVGHVICPYNVSHVIRIEKIQFHLAKCEQGKNKARYSVCPFNSTHLIPSSEILNHKNNLCPDRVKFDTFIYEQETTEPLFPVQNIKVESSENWDDLNVPTYNPEKALENKKVLQLKQVVPPSERRRFHAEQRKKFQALSNMEEDLEKERKAKETQRLPMSKSAALSGPKMANEAKKNENLLKQNSEIEMKSVEQEPNKKNNKDDGFQVVGKRGKKTPEVAKKQEIKNAPKIQNKVEPQLQNKENVSNKSVDQRNDCFEENVSVIEEKKNDEDDFVLVTKKKNRSGKRK